MLRQRAASGTARCSDGLHPCLPRSLACRKLPRTARHPSLQPAATSTIQTQSSSGNEAPAGKVAGPQHNHPQVQPSSMFYDHHITRWTPQLLLYFPIGIVLALLRSALWIVCIGLDQPWFRNPEVISGYLSLLGVRVVWEGEEHIPSDEPHVLVSNHLSVGDLMALFTRPQRYVHLITNALPQPVFAASHLPVSLRPASKASYEELAAAFHSNMDPSISSFASFSEVESDLEEAAEPAATPQQQQQHGTAVVLELHQPSDWVTAAASGVRGLYGSAATLSSTHKEGAEAHHSSKVLLSGTSSSSSNNDGSPQQVLHHAPPASSLSAAAAGHGALSSPAGAGDMATSSTSSSKDGGGSSINGSSVSVQAMNYGHVTAASSSSSRLLLPASGPLELQKQPPSVHLFPEGGMTNGRAMMQFSRGFLRFAAPLPVVPVALRLVTPLQTVTGHTLTSGFLANLFWFSFQPWCELRATALPPQRYQPDSSKAGFVHAVQEAIAAELGVPVAELNIQQKRKLAHRRK